MAKLVEILAGKLSEWPEEAVAIAQDHDECAHPYDSASLEFNHGEWGGEEAEVQISSFNVRMPERASDYSTAIVTRAEWQAAVDALNERDRASSTAAMIDAGWIDPRSPVSLSLHAQSCGRIKRVVEWNGEGLPPVGTFCCYHHVHHGGAWYEGEILYISDEYTIIKGHPVGEQHYYTRNLEFRPIRTPEQIAAEEREAVIREMAEIIGKRIAATNAAADLYDAGYRKQEPK